MKESTWWKSLLPKLQRPGTRFTRHEDRSAGILDVSYTIKVFQRDTLVLFDYSVSGWLELKYSPRYPVKETSIIPLRHFKMAQKLFIWKELDCGGRAFILWRIAKDIYLFRGDVANKLGSSIRSELASCATKVWNYRDAGLYDELLEELKK